MARTLTACGIILVGGLLATTVNAEESQRMIEGRQAYEGACASCHDTGLTGAPVTNRPADWEGRSSLWEAVLFEHANKGYLKMPARGGKESMDEYDVDAAAEYMLTITNPDLPAD